MHTETIRDHWLTDAVPIPSPNCDDRPAGVNASLIVIHCISLPPGRFGSEDISRLFINRLDPEADPFFRQIIHLRVSAHLLIRRDGGLIQYVPFHSRAWHAGLSSFRGQSVCNDFSIGIELEGTDDSPYEPIQYRRLNAALRALLATYPSLSAERITGHSDIAPHRKTDPGRCFDWRRILLDDDGNAIP
jgi:AmpD protein